MNCEIILLVENIDVCRYFYRETLQLGEPELDSNFQVVFRLNPNTSLVLERCETAYMEHASASCRFSLECKDLNKLQESMRLNGTPLGEAFQRLGKKCFRGTDPEGNLFQVLCPQDA